jgi:N-dimethylarginine dimethylaminohydrolase
MRLRWSVRWAATSPRFAGAEGASDMHASVYERIENLPTGFDPRALPAMDYPRGVLLCPPDHFDVVDVKNPFMAGKAGTVDKPEAHRQWAALCDAMRAAGAEVEVLPALPGCEDMVFCANTAFLGIDGNGRKACVPSRMTFESRRPEVGPMLRWATDHGFAALEAGDPSLPFEGSGDAIWHPGRRLIWGGYGWRTDPHVYPSLAQAMGAPVLVLPLTDSTYYHLDTCFCPIDESTVLVHEPAIAVEGMALVRKAFERVVEVEADEAERFACNAAAFFGRVVVIDRRAAATSAQLRSMGYETIEVDTGEFIKSGGSVYCMKNAFF